MRIIHLIQHYDQQKLLDFAEVLIFGNQHVYCQIQNVVLLSILMNFLKLNQSEQIFDWKNMFNSNIQINIQILSL